MIITCCEWVECWMGITLREGWYELCDIKYQPPKMLWWAEMWAECWVAIIMTHVDMGWLVLWTNTTCGVWAECWKTVGRNVERMLVECWENIGVMLWVGTMLRGCWYKFILLNNHSAHTPHVVLVHKTNQPISTCVIITWAGWKYLVSTGKSNLGYSGGWIM